MQLIKLDSGVYINPDNICYIYGKLNKRRLQMNNDSYESTCLALTEKDYNTLLKLFYNKSPLNLSINN